MVVTDPTEKLCTLLQATRRQSGAPQKFEQALAEAFAALGFEARHIGGSGETDIFISAHLGQSSYSGVLDAKTTQSGKVPDAQINWPVIDSHRQSRGATYAAVVGEDFSGGQLQKFADQYRVTLLTTGMLCDTLRLHASTPFSLIELRDLFFACPTDMHLLLNATFKASRAPIEMGPQAAPSQQRSGDRG